MEQQTKPRFSMKEFKPLSMVEKANDAEDVVLSIDEARYELIKRKKEIELDLSVISNRVRAEANIPYNEYSELCRKQNELKKEKTSIENELLTLKQRRTAKNMEIDKIKRQLKFQPKEIIEDGLISLRDKYTQFAADKTRVASMRAMAAEFVGELTRLIEVK